MRPSHVRALLLTSLVATAGSCRSSVGPVTDPRLAITATTSQSRVPAGEPMWISIVIRNNSAHPVEIPGGPAAFLEVRDVQGERVAFGRFEILPMIAYVPRSLAPGDSVMDQAPWAGEVNEGGGGDHAAVGAYTIRAAVPILGEDAGEYAYSPPVDVELVAP